MNRIYRTTFIFLSFIAASCELPEESAVIDTQIPPRIIEASIAPTDIDFGKVPASGSTVNITAVGYVNTIDDNGLNDIASVRYSIYSPNGKLFASGALADNGVFPDAAAGDGKFNSNIDLALPKDIIGTYSVQFSTSDKMGFKSNTFNLPLKITLSTNHSPAISQLVCPDSVRVPNSADSVNLVEISLNVSDQEGLNDVVSVVLTSLRPDSSIAGTFFLYDDGGNIVHSQFGLPSGDDAANDGTYSIIVPIFSTTQRNTYRDFVFTARDQSGATSNAITKRILIQ